jgi:hypothetical protein
MKVLAVKGIEKYSNLWAVRYARQHGKNMQDAVFLCATPGKAKQKYKELLDILLHHDGVYIGSKEKRKSDTPGKAGGLMSGTASKAVGGC